MMKKFASIMEFAKEFATDEACWKYLESVRWPNGFICPICGAPARTFTKKRRKWTCKNEHQVSLISGTIMHGTKLPLTKWFWAAYLFATQTPGISSIQLEKKIDVTHETAFMMLHKLRAGTVNPEREKLHGIVQVDETAVGGEGKGERGRAYAPEKSIVIGAVKLRGEKFGRVRLRRITNFRGKTLVGFIKAHVEKGSTIITDGFKGYAGLKKKGYKHIVYEGETSKDVAEMLRHIHIIFSNLKAFINGTYHGVSKRHLQAYLNEFVFRFNRRVFDLSIFNMLLGIGVEIRSPRYEDIYAVRRQEWSHVAGI